MSLQVFINAASKLENPITACAMRQVENWRNEGAKEGDLMGRKIVFSAAALLSIPFMLIEAIASIALTILTSPLMFTSRDDIPKALACRSALAVLGSGISLTITQYNNIVERKTNIYDI